MEEEIDYKKAERILWNFGLNKKQGSYTKSEIAKAIIRAYESGKRDGSILMEKP